MTDLVIRFRKPGDWADSVHLHYWDARPSGGGTDWPGMPMTAEGGGWYVCTFERIEAASFVINDTAGHQTGDLRRERGGWYDLDDGWSDEKPGTGKAKRTKAAAPKAKPAPKPMFDDPHDFRRETIYFLITTRFYDGDPSNNFFCRDRIKFNAATGEPEDPHWRGDFKGLIERLDYITDLGFTAIWITPPVENRSGLDYHGYHAYDWTRIDPRLESPGATYQDLIDAAHTRGIKIIQDVVINHSCQYGIRGKVHIDHLPIKYYVPHGSEQGRVNHGPYQGNLGNYAWPNRDDIDNPLAPDWYRERIDRDPEGREPLKDPKTGETVPKPGYNPGRFFGVDAGSLDPEWYHQEGFICGGDWESAASAAGQAHRRRLHRPRDRAAERQGLPDRARSTATSTWASMRCASTRSSTSSATICSNTSMPGRLTSRGCSSSARTWSRATAGATWAAATTAPRRSGPGGTPASATIRATPPPAATPASPSSTSGCSRSFRDTVSKGTFGGTAQVDQHGLDLRRSDDADHLPAKPRRRPRQRLQVPLQGRAVDGGGGL